MARIPLIDKKEILPAEHRGIYDAIAQSRGAVRGPFSALLHSPEIAQRTAHLGAYNGWVLRSGHIFASFYISPDRVLQPGLSLVEST